MDPFHTPLSALQNHIINAAEGDNSMEGFSNVADVGHDGLNQQD